MFKFIFAFHIFVLEGSLVNRIDSQFVFDSLVECRTAEMLIQNKKTLITVLNNIPIKLVITHLIT